MPCIEVPPAQAPRQVIRFDDFVARVCADDGGGGFRRAVAAVAPRREPARRQRPRGLSRPARRDRARPRRRPDRRGGGGSRQGRGVAPLLAAADSAESGDAPAAETDTETDLDARDRSSLWRRRITAVAALLLVPIGAAALYLQLGSPQLPGEPLHARLHAIHENRPIAKLVAQVETHLAKNPNDVRGYEVLAPVYLRLGRFAGRGARAPEGDRACRRQRRAPGRSRRSAHCRRQRRRHRQSQDALSSARSSSIRTSSRPSSSAAWPPQQDGKVDKAAAIWRGMLAKAPADAPWAPTVRQALAKIGKPVRRHRRSRRGRRAGRARRRSPAPPT